MLGAVLRTAHQRAHWNVRETRNGAHLIRLWCSVARECAFTFEIVHESKRSNARAGIIRTPHGVIETPSFVPVATNAAIKSVPPSQVPEGVQLMFCNTYHLMLHPGSDVVAKAGGLHSFMNYQRPIITDSGGFQVFSLAYGSVHEELGSGGARKDAQGAKDRDGAGVVKRRREHGAHQSVLKISEEGVKFSSYRDGTRFLLTPESSVQAQKQLGADIIIPLDELPPYHTTPQALLDSFLRTHRWQQRSLEEHLKHPQQQAMYGVVHGGLDRELRARSIRELANQPYDGMAIGGSLGADRQDVAKLVRDISPLLPRERPRHLLGIGDWESMQQGISCGMDTFDSCYPTRAARHGTLFMSDGTVVRIQQAVHKLDQGAIDASCDCAACTSTSRAYLHHLFKAKEGAAHVLATIHNIHAYTRRMARVRDAILQDDL